jgi:hypothetical protein
MCSSWFRLFHARSFRLARLRAQRPAAATRKAKPYNIARDISTNGSGQWAAGGYIVKANPREVFGAALSYFAAKGGRAAGGILPAEGPSAQRREK